MATIGIAINNDNTNAGIAGELQARFYDPLWTLGRQWQLGEFRGEDCGSPTSVRIELEEVAVNGYRPGGGQGELDEYAAARSPLEMLVEREAAVAVLGASWREAAEAGQQLVRMVKLADPVLSRYDTPLLRGYGLKSPAADVMSSVDDDSRRMMAVLVGRVVDGAALLQEIQASSVQAVAAKVVQAGVDGPGPQSDGDKLANVLSEWLRWCDTRVSLAPPQRDSWQSERMEYRFDLAARTAIGTLELKAEEYYDGDLDWYAVDAAPPPTPEPQLTTAVRTLDVLPSPISYYGMPMPRFWEMEDARVNFAAVKADPEDLPRRLLLKFALECSNDWFVVPVELPVGGLSRIRSLVVSNSFGERHLISHASEADQARGRWRAFALSNDSQNWFYLPASLAQSLQGRPIEEVWLQRDEGANLAWAMQLLTPGLAGTTLDRRELQPSVRPDSPAGQENARIYRLGTTVPAYWRPLLPARTSAGMRLRQARIGGTGSELPPIMCRDRLLPVDQNLDLFDEEVPAEGIQVTRAYQYARWTDGSTHLWIGRRKRPSQGDASSGLVFDVLE